MKWIEVKILFESAFPEMAGERIAVIFYDLGLKGVSLEEPGLEPEEGWGDDAVEQPSHYSVSGFFPFRDFTDKKRSLLKEKLSMIERENEILSKVVYREIDEEDWAESWKEYFWPERISDKIVVKPTWREYEPKKDELIIEIDPGMAFGTGTHPTTALCIRMIEKYLRPGESFLDIGTGSGILMIAAAKLGAEILWGVDNDMVAVEIAEQNLRLNTIEKSRFQIISGNLVDDIHQKFSMVTANILSEVIIELLDDIREVTAEGSILICSGIIEENAGGVIEKMKKSGFSIAEVAEEEKWVCIVARTPNQG
ncbi:MAG: 50S ribosomal protein L11 methyltransferase [Desulfobacterales bacterium]